MPSSRVLRRVSGGLVWRSTRYGGRSLSDMAEEVTRGTSKEQDAKHRPPAGRTPEDQSTSTEEPEEEEEEEEQQVEMWNRSAPAGPEWGGPREHEPTRYGDWARRGRVSDF
ncbi:hypothetical protein CDCA_CDCA01G0363 [Cyanidium caldarium]|uniref:Succinate dehydrogenase assembly factor 4, mitochondrial n=1 Tax=Cyanidium caldarium TaxID=2771 RepID=A0AAV9IQQ7_CYACA|nr:hypothetical protein CDCA_CDCA01G0363 [Cyanidium caldarium]